MKYMVMHKVDAKMEAGDPPPKGIVEQMGKLVQSSLKSGVFEDGAGLHRSALRVRVRTRGGAREVTKGPYAGDNELVASFAMIKADSIDQAAEVAGRLAGALGDGEIEVGPVVEPWDLKLGPKPDRAPTRFLLLRKGDRAYETGAKQPAGYDKLIDELRRDGTLLSAASLAPSSEGARLRKTGVKRAWTDGPFAESKELVAGYSIVNLPSLAEARTWADHYADILGDTEVDVRVVAP
jgi:hypothetical protein